MVAADPAATMASWLYPPGCLALERGALQERSIFRRLITDPVGLLLGLCGRYDARLPRPTKAAGCVRGSRPTSGHKQRELDVEEERLWRPVAEVCRGIFRELKGDPTIRKQAARDEAYATVTAADWPVDWASTTPRLARLIRVNAHRPELAALYAEVAQAAQAAQAGEERSGA